MTILKKTCPNLNEKIQDTVTTDTKSFIRQRQHCRCSMIMINSVPDIISSKKRGQTKPFFSLPVHRSSNNYSILSIQEGRRESFTGNVQKSTGLCLVFNLQPYYCIIHRQTHRQFSLSLTHTLTLGALSPSHIILQHITRMLWNLPAAVKFNL